MYFSDLEKIDDELEDATQDLVKDLTTLADKHAAAIGKYPALVGSEPSKSAENKEPNKNKGRPGNLRSNFHVVSRPICLRNRSHWCDDWCIGWCIHWCVAAPLLFGERGGELAAEGWDLGDRAGHKGVLFLHMENFMQIFCG